LLHGRRSGFPLRRPLSVATPIQKFKQLKQSSFRATISGAVICFAAVCIVIVVAFLESGLVLEEAMGWVFFVPHLS
jgi:hypothetical protein